MSLVSRVFYFFTPYADREERLVGKFFKSLTEQDSPIESRVGLDALLQGNIAIINLWTEYKYKGYKYLKKSHRKQLYANLQLIAADFDRYYKNNARTAEVVVSHTQSLAPQATIETEKTVFLQALMDYFSPTRGLYEYRDASSFGRLLRDPSHEKLIGDCNQIVTLYIYLYSRYFDIHDLQIRMLPGHVALNYGGIDIEATTGSFANYNEAEDTIVLPIEEIVSINLLDTTDSYLSTHEVAAEDLLQASRFAFILSHNRDVVTRNLDVAYKSLVKTLLERNNYSKALKYATASGNQELLGIVGNNGAIYEMEHRNYAAARRYAQHAPEHDTLTTSSWRAEGVQHYEEHRYHEAIKAFEHLNDQTLIRRCYEALFFEEQKKLGSNITDESIKNHATSIKHMRTYARKSGNKELIEYADNLHKYL
jgi:hypothetical protein